MPVGDGSDGAHTEAPRTVGWRRTLGVIIFVVALILPLIALAVVPILGLDESANTALIGISLVGGPDVLFVAAIALLGRAGVEELMAKTGNGIKRIARWDSVSRRRYTIGLWVLVLGGLILPNTVLFFWHDSVRQIGGSPGWAFYVLIVATVAFIGSVLAMGAPFWTRVEAMFDYDAEITFPESDSIR